MTTETYRFQVGEFRCVVINDGYITGGSITDSYPQAPIDELKLAFSSLLVAPDRYAFPNNCMFVDTGRHRVLLDTGGGKNVPSLGKFADGLAPSPKLGALTMGLELEQIEPDSIDIVIITHSHFDHVGGNVDDNGNPLFPNARYVFARGEWDDIKSMQLPDDDEEWNGWVPALRYARMKCLAVERLVEFVDSEVEIVPDVRIIQTPGETPHHISVEFTSGSERLVCAGDALKQPFEVEHPDWLLESHKPSNHKLLKRAAGGATLVHGYHFPFPGVGRIMLNGDGWKWLDL